MFIDLPGPLISFNLSLTPAELKKGANNVTVITCSSSSYVGGFSICYSKNLSDLQRLAVKEEQCCYCSSIGADKCNKMFPNWDLTITPVEQTNQLNCDAVLKNVTEADVGFYQCRVYDVYHYPCQRRFERIYNYSISTANNNDHSSSKGHFSVPDIDIYIGVAVVFLITIVTIVTFGIICWKCKSSSSHFTHSKLLAIHLATCDQLYDVASYALLLAS